MIILILLLIFIFLYAIFFVPQFYNIIFNNYAPFISTDKKTVQKIMSEVSIQDQAIVYELGCGWSKFLRVVEKDFPTTKVVGIENLFGLYLVNKIKLYLQKSRIKLLKKDFFTLNLENADLIYCYLNNPTMEKLGKKCKEECKPGTHIISRSFSIPQLKPEKVVRIQNKNIYFYKI